MFSLHIYHTGITKNFRASRTSRAERTSLFQCTCECIPDSDAVSLRKSSPSRTRVQFLFASKSHSVRRQKECAGEGVEKRGPLAFECRLFKWIYR
ncbi:hypothetical protein CDAR_293441 [Caerostris darwini]|uniref:Uncharacterized protein n=1 Tax=Caerostris darwini TaxID=1538125 RepID=A0AAV4RGK4_9ARAC|nr:hypothetical protein CDAR_293441 [Caerostris darwini]